MSKTMPIAASLAAAALLLSQTPTGSTGFLEKPYLQLGDAPKLSPQESLVLLWHTENVPAKWSVELRTSKDKNWRAVAEDITAMHATGRPVLAGTRSFLLYDNYDALLGYNCAHSYTLSVALLSDLLK